MRSSLSRYPSTLRLRAPGVGFLGLLALGAVMTYAVFDKTFVDVVRVTAHTDRAGLSGTAAEQHLVDALAAPVMRTDLEDVPDVATLLFGPIARGTEVSVR